MRASLARLRVPGFCVFRWERHWHVDGQPFRDPAEYPPTSVATSGTHDTEPLIVWWEQAPAAERAKAARLPTLLRMSDGASIESAPYNPIVRDAILEALFASGSNLLLLPVQDVFGWRERINEPATVSAGNWTFKLPWLCDRLDDVPEARERRDTLHEWTAAHRRL